MTHGPTYLRHCEAIRFDSHPSTFVVKGFECDPLRSPFSGDISGFCNLWGSSTEPSSVVYRELTSDELNLSGIVSPFRLSSL